MAKKFDAKAKAKRQKIIAAVLGVLLLGVLAYQVPSLMKGKKPPVTAAATTPVTMTTPDPAAAPPAAGAVAATPVSAPLVNSDPAAEAATGQLVSFDRFVSKDPFLQQLSTDAAPAAASAPTTTAAPKTPTPPPAAHEPAAAPSSAAISVNGTTETVAIAGTFPQADPVFVLVSLKKASAKIAIAGGSFDTGTSAVTLVKGKRVTLMNTADGTRYVLLLVSVS